MSYPIFQKGEVFSLSKIQEIIKSGEGIEPYSKGQFKYLGINPDLDYGCEIENEDLLRLEKALQTESQVKLYTKGNSRNGTILVIVLESKSADVHIPKDLNFNLKDKKDFNQLLNVLKEQIKIKQKDE